MKTIRILLRNTFVVLTVLTILVAADRVCAETSQSSCPVSESGFVIGYGTGNIEEGEYRPLLMIWHIGFPLKQCSPRGSDGRQNVLSWYLEPQINPAFTPSTNVEFGIGIGLKYMHHIVERFAVYAMASVGPHWITLQTRNQTNGFIFSDMAGVGGSIFITDRSALNLELRVRHLSNAGLEKPNGGIDSWFGAVGYSVFF